jgi:hypothetical protein
LKTKIIEITVSPGGETTVQTKGFSGSACRDASRAIEALLGQRTSEQLTSEFYQESEQHRQEQEGA